MNEERGGVVWSIWFLALVLRVSSLSSSSSLLVVVPCVFVIFISYAMGCVRPLYGPKLVQDFGAVELPGACCGCDFLISRTTQSLNT
jgi:hypothetical protein